jgi:hypothetical protein
MRIEEVTLEEVTVEPEGGHRDRAVYDTVTFRVFPAGHPNSFRVPVPVNTDQYPPEAIEDHARFMFHRLIRAVAEATRDWDALDPRPLDKD